MRSSTSKPGHVRQFEVENDAVIVRFAQRFQRGGAGFGGNDLDIVVAEQFGDAHPLGRIVFHDQQAFPPRLRILLDACERGLDALGRRGLGDKGERSARQGVLAIFVKRDDLNRNMPGQRVLLELAQHRPAQHVRQEHIERNRARLELLGKFERVGAARGHQDLEPLVAGEIHDDARVMRIVLDNEKDGIARLDLKPVVWDLLDLPFG